MAILVLLALPLLVVSVMADFGNDPSPMVQLHVSPMVPQPAVSVPVKWIALLYLVLCVTEVTTVDNALRMWVSFQIAFVRHCVIIMTCSYWCYHFYTVFYQMMTA